MNRRDLLVALASAAVLALLRRLAGADRPGEPPPAPPPTPPPPSPPRIAPPPLSVKRHA